MSIETERILFAILLPIAISVSLVIGLIVAFCSMNEFSKLMEKLNNKIDKTLNNKQVEQEIRNKLNEYKKKKP